MKFKENEDEYTDNFLGKLGVGGHMEEWEHKGSS